MVKNRIFALSFRASAVVICMLGVLAQMDAFTDNFSARTLLYYTLQSNLLVIVLFGVLTIKTAIDLKHYGCRGGAGYFPRISAAFMLAIFLTMFIFWALLSFLMGPDYLLSFDNFSVHLICPLFMIADYFMFSQAGKLKKHDPFLFSAIPLGYFVQGTILGFSGVHYYFPGTEEVLHFPYFFMDYYSIGWLVAPYVVGIGAFYIGLGYLLLFIDRKRLKVQNVKNLSERSRSIF